MHFGALRRVHRQTGEKLLRFSCGVGSLACAAMSASESEARLMEIGRTDERGFQAIDRFR